MPKYLANPTKWHDHSLAWAPDGRKLYFQRKYGLGWGEATDGYLIDLNDGNIEYLGVQGGMDSFATGQILFEAEGQLSLYDIKTKKTHELGDGWNGFISIDEGKIVYVTESRRKVAEKWVFSTNLLLRNASARTAMTLLTSESDKFWSPTLSFNGYKIVFTREGQGLQAGVWSISVDGSNLKKLADNAASPKITSIPRLSFIAPNVAKIIILVAIALTGISLLFGMALIARKAINAVVPRVRAAPRGIFCPQCGNENSPSASFCTSCGHKLH